MLIVIFLLFIFDLSFQAVCPAGQTSFEGSIFCFSRKFSKDTFPINVPRAASQDITKTLKYTTKQVPSIFTIQLWIKFLESQTTATHRTIVYQENRFEWTYDFALNGFSFDLTGTPVNANEASCTVYKSPIIYDKWLHYTISRDNAGLFQVFLYGDDLVMKATPISMIMENPSSTSDLYIGTTKTLTDANRFDGYFRDFRIWKSVISPANAKLNFYKEQTEFPSDLLMYVTMDMSRGDGFADQVSKNGNIGAPYRLEQIHDDPICCKKGQTCGTKIFDGITCQGDAKYINFDGTYELTLPAQFIGPADTVFISVWFKPIITESSVSKQTLVYMENVFELVYDRSISDDLTLGDAIIKISYLSTPPKERYVTVPKQSNIWMQVIATLDFANGKLYLEVPGLYFLLFYNWYSQTDKNPLTPVTTGSVSGTLHIGGGQNGRFTGLMREFVFSNKGLYDYVINRQYFFIKRTKKTNEIWIEGYCGNCKIIFKIK